MKISVTLENTGGILDTREIDTRDDDSAEVSTAIWDAIDDWMLSPGDVIRIAEKPYDYAADDQAFDAAREARVFGRGR